LILNRKREEENEAKEAPICEASEEAGAPPEKREARRGWDCPRKGEE
jgi:hypothetical protein